MKPEDFVQRWNGYTARTEQADDARLEVLPASDSRLSDATNHFLTSVGLPKGAGLRFNQLRNGLQRVYEVFGMTAEWREEVAAALDYYIVIGSDVNGNPVCLDLANQECLRLLHRTSNFTPYAFINSSVAQLAECILIYQELVETFQNEYKGEEDVLYDGGVPLSMVKAALAHMKACDAACVVSNGYWQGVLVYI